MTLDTEVLKEVPYPEYMSWELAERWASIPRFSENDPDNPEWRESPTIPVDYSRDGLAEVLVKDEADPASNPNQVAKDRPNWEEVCDHRDYGQRLLEDKDRINGSIETIPVPRVSILTSANAGASLAYWMERFDLPPPKLLIGTDLPDSVVTKLLSLRADLYRCDLKQEALSDAQIKEGVRMPVGTDLTSDRVRDPQGRSYDWQFHESANERPTHILMGYGSGLNFENYITWQHRNLVDNPDPRLRISPVDLASISIIGVEPEDITNSSADKLTAAHKPFTLYTPAMLESMKARRETGPLTGIIRVPEDVIGAGYELMRRGFATGPSGSSGLAGYAHLFGQGVIGPDDRVLVLNSGVDILNGA